MTDALVLFCGGPAIYSGLPKPLQKLRTGETLIERYLNYTQPNEHSEVVLLVDKAYYSGYRELLKDFLSSAKITILTCEDNSSTFGKLQAFIKSGYPADRTLTFTYPDVFIAGRIGTPDPTDPRLVDNVFISFTPVFSRFPRLVVDPYDYTVQGISNHTSPMPANPLHVFGGHLLVRSGLMNTLIDDFLADIVLPAPSLEFDMFFWLINTNRMQSMPIHGQWIQADSVRDVEAILCLSSIYS